jgi:hypothetical protein
VQQLRDGTRALSHFIYFHSTSYNDSQMVISLAPEIRHLHQIWAPDAKQMLGILTARSVRSEQQGLRVQCA